MKYQLAIFDFDGTLADSYPWFLTVMNSLADKYGFRRIEPNEIDAMRGMESRQIIGQLGVPMWKLPLIANHMRKLKAESRTQIALFPGVDRMLRELKTRGMTLAMVSSDSERNVRAMLGSENAAQIDLYACGASMFGKAAHFKSVLRRTGIPPAATIAIGDEMRDADAATQAGIAFAAVAWGYATLDALASKKPEKIFHCMDEIVLQIAGASAQLE